MAYSLKIKEEFKTTIVAFGSSGLPLGERPESDLIALARMAQYDKHLANYFEVLPSTEELNAQAEEKLLEAHPAPAEVNSNENPDEEVK